MLPLAMTLALLSHWQILLVLLVILLLFGNRIPAMARALGSGIVEFKKGLRSENDDEKKLPPASGSGSTFEFKKGLRSEGDAEKKIPPSSGASGAGN